VPAMTALIIINGLQYANGSLGEVLDKFLDDHLDRTQPPLPQKPRDQVPARHDRIVERNRAHNELAEELGSLERDAADHVLASVDRESLAAAGVRSITVEVRINLQTAA